jgi:hypothetical protein
MIDKYTYFLNITREFRPTVEIADWLSLYVDLFIYGG